MTEQTQRRQCIEQLKSDWTLKNFSFLESRRAIFSTFKHNSRTPEKQTSNPIQTNAIAKKPNIL